jgi:prolyl-tRNA synthetase
MDDTQDTLPQKRDFHAWYNELLWRASVMDVRYPVKGLYVWYPHGFAIRRLVYEWLRTLMDRDHEEALFPLLIPEQEFMKEAEHIKGFEEEVYWVTHGGTAKLEVPLALRPTSETAIYPMYALWVRSHADLPIRIYQIVNTFRYETKHTRPLIRLREITSFKEAHTVHASWDDAEAQVRYAIALYQEFYEGLGIPVIISRRPDWDKFPGADHTIAVDTVMPDGKTLQIGTVHHLADHFSRTFQILYEDEAGVQQYAQQTCYGISERSIAALISTHGDDRGLVLPPAVAPVQVVVIPITIGKRKDDVLTAARQTADNLRAAGLRVRLDERDIRPGAKYYYWEMRGVPVRIEIGPRDLDAGQVMAITRLGEKSAIPTGETLVTGVVGTLNRVREDLLARARIQLTSKVKVANSASEVRSALEGGVAVTGWCGGRECADAIEATVDGTVLGSDVYLEEIALPERRCMICGSDGKNTLVGRSY